MNKNTGLILVAVLALVGAGFFVLRGQQVAVSDGDLPISSLETGELESKAEQESTAASPNDPKETTAASATPPETGESSLPTPRAGLAATDPETVNLGSGEIQLVEFFAFW